MNTTMNNTKSILLEFDPKLNKLNKTSELRHGLSAVVQIGDTLWVANDETISVERLVLQTESPADGYHYSRHKQFLLSDYLSLAALRRQVQQKSKRPTSKVSPIRMAIFGWWVHTA